MFDGATLLGMTRHHEVKAADFLREAHRFDDLASMIRAERGLGRLLTLTGLHHLAGLGLGEVLLYVESDNTPAIATYSGLGFTHAGADTHVMYRNR